VVTLSPYWEEGQVFDWLIYNCSGYWVHGSRFKEYSLTECTEGTEWNLWIFYNKKNILKM